MLNQWRTEVRGQADGAGTFRSRGFLGEYEIEASAGQLRGVAQATLGRDGVAVRLALE